MDNGLKSDGSVDRVFVEELIPEAADATDEQIIAYIEELKAKKEANPEGLEISYVLVAYFSGEDKLAEADSMSFIGMPTSGNPLLGLPITKAKGNLNLGKVTSEGATSVADIKADTTSFDMSEEALAAMTTVNDALKTFKNLYVNTDLEAETTVTITPTFNWEDSIASLKAGTSDPEDFVYEGYSSYIAPRGHDIPLDQACAETEADRLIFKITPPVAQSRTVGDLDEVIDSSNPLSNEGTVTSALKSENNGDRKSCLVGNNYFAGTDADGLEQIGGLDFPGIAPDGLWTLEKGNETFAKFDLGLSNPVAEDKHIKMFVPKLVMETSGGKITKFTITFSAWDEASSSYKELSDLSAFKRVVTEFGIGVNRYNDQGGSNEAGGARPDTIEGNAYVVEKFIDQAESEVSIDDPSEEANKGSIMLYYRAFGNSYNFFWMPE